MKTVKLNVFRYEELSEESKENVKLYLNLMFTKAYFEKEGNTYEDQAKKSLWFTNGDVYNEKILNPVDEDDRRSLLRDAKKETANLVAIKTVIGLDNDCEAVLQIDRKYRHAFSSSSMFLKVIDEEIAEIEKAIEGKPNNWQ